MHHWRKVMCDMVLVGWAALSVGAVRGQVSSASAQDKMRGLRDTVGFAHTAAQIEQIVRAAEMLEMEQLLANATRFNLDNDSRWVAAVCPHDDHLLAGRVYVHVFRHLRAPRVVLFGVAHKANDYRLRDVLVFDSFVTWRGPYGPVPVSPLRQELLARLPANTYVVNDEFQGVEHSVEGIVPFLQHYVREAEIVSILVPPMNWHRIDELSAHLAKALAEAVRRHKWVLGRDIAFICSNDGDHYGDQDWGGRNMAPFGADLCGYRIQTAMDSLLALSTLAGPLAAPKLESFCRQVWAEDDISQYKIRWCGRFAVPFGLETVRKTVAALGLSPLNGYLLRYDTSYRLGTLPLPTIGLGTTAPYHLRHWVGYTAIGYR
ncbi:MAG: AmmeMemoRadiSam system protein B [candidate division KSB1 bacterium]|nr:AmmeMemoRadiSam system protein B [candidate division KSB1 bacterium]MDZ7294836.1 AmmeMemoRadiSam system protein B [candidate division KSB1 bacterium]MDZ7386386.1 AmmeMemoRadiSam system protein B [candidate division KSB1 bacterium]MDZ7393473.1 AmmeMemoRadiSam system protein B [candidate division KSB1 bacterium]MDZ7413337.1 AmmeMemoRadiSam system protein B [candidate division KSB1 bacterium]